MPYDHRGHAEVHGADSLGRGRNIRSGRGEAEGDPPRPHGRRVVKLKEASLKDVSLLTGFQAAGGRGRRGQGLLARKRMEINGASSATAVFFMRFSLCSA